MLSTRWLYTAPLYPDALQWAEDGHVAAAAGPVALVVDPYRLEESVRFTETCGFDAASVSRTKASPKDVRNSIGFAMETLTEFAMQDAMWKAAVRQVAWSPRGAFPGLNESLLALVQSDRKVHGAQSHQFCCKDAVLCGGPSVSALQETTEDWKNPVLLLRLRGGGRGRGSGRGRGRGRTARKFPLTEPTNASREMIQEFQFAPEMEACLASSLEAHDGNQFRLDLPKVVLSLWLELRSHVPEDELPTYKKGEYLNGVDHYIYHRVMQHMLEMYGAAMQEYDITQKYLETRSRALIRKKAIVSFDPVWRGRRFHAPESVLSLIGQEGREQAFDNQDMTPLTFQSTQIITTETAALCVGATIQTVRQVKPQSGRKRKSMGQGKPRLICHFPDAIQNETYERRRMLLSVACISWSPIWCHSSLLAVGTSSGHVLLWRLSASDDNRGKGGASEHFGVLGATMVSQAEISALKWIVFPDEKSDLSSNRLLLATADVMGEMRIWTVHPEAFSSEQDSLQNPVLQEGCLICPSDARPVSCLTCNILLLDNGSYGLRMYVGKYSGVLTVWESAAFSEDLFVDAFSQWVQNGRMLSLEGCHSHKAITGIASNLFLDCIATVGLDSRLCLWKIEQETLTPCTSELVQSLVDVSDYQPCYGIVSSPSGLMIAAIRDLGEKYRDAQLQRMVWKRVAHGSIELRSIVASANDDTWAAVKKYISKRMKHDADTAMMVDVGYWLKMIASEDKFPKDQEEDTIHLHGADEGTPAPAGEDDMELDTTDERLLPMKQSQAHEFAQFIIEQLGEELEEWTPAMGHKEQQKWRAMNAFVYTVKDTVLFDCLKMWSKRAERCLAQTHVLHVLSLNKTSVESLTSALSRSRKQDLPEIQARMAQWVLHFENELHPAIVQAAKSYQREVPNALSSLTVENSDDPVDAMTRCCLKIDDTLMRLKRCPVTFSDVTEIHPSCWRCRICDRCYHLSSQQLTRSPDASPFCLFCGGALCH